MSEAQSFSVCRLSFTSLLVPPVLVLYAPSLTLGSPNPSTLCTIINTEFLEDVVLYLHAYA